MVSRIAKSLDTLRGEIDTAHPNRSKRSDGWIGDAKHAARTSDHNPWVKDGKDGVVTGVDITHDPANGVDTYILARRMVESPDPRLKYVISNGEIASRDKGWRWRKYTGTNPHDHHVHFSVEPTKKLYDDTSSWGIGKIGDPDPRAAPADDPYRPVIRLGARGPAVAKAQGLLLRHGAVLEVDEDFGKKTQAAVRAFQKSRKLTADGVIGPSTWSALERDA